MASFDVDGYFAKRYGSPGADKLQALAKASQDKVNELMAFREAKGAGSVPQAPADNSLVSKLGLNPNGLAGSTVNLAASLGSGATRVAGQLASLPSNALSISYSNQLNDQDNEAYGRYNQGSATPEDLALLSSTKGGPLTVLQLFEKANQTLKDGRAISDFMDTTNIVHQGKRDRLQRELGDDFQGAWNQTTRGVDGISDGNGLSGTADMVAGIARLGGNAAHALITNPGAVGEYVAENAPQLLMGATGKAGQAALAASNVGYGAEYYQKGIQKYQDAGDGSLPPVAQRQDMGLHAALAVGAEQVGDMIQLGAMKLAKNSVDEITRTGFKESLKNIGKAGGKGFATEAPTEAFQTYAEGEASLMPASDKDIYIGGVIGGASGAGLTGGGRAVAEIAGATPEKQAKKAEQAVKDQEFQANTVTGNTDTYLDKSSKDYDPLKAAQVNYVNSLSAETTPEAKLQNVDKTNTLIKELETERADLALTLSKTTPEGIQKQITDLEAGLANAPPQLAELKQMHIDSLKQDLAAFDPKQNDPKAAKQLEARLSRLDRQLAEVTKVRDSLMVDTQPKEADVIAAVDKADAEIDATSEEGKAASQASANHVISLAMRHPGMFSDESLTRLTNNARNSLSDSQRAYLRTVSASKLAENATKDGATVSKEIIKGDPAKHQLGIADYTARMAMAISANDTDKASTALHMLGKFAAGHAQKLALFKPLYEAAKKSGPTWVIPTKQGWEVASNQGLGDELRTKFGGLKIGVKSSKLLKGIELEVAALNAAQTQLQTAYNLKFDPTAVVNSSTDSVVNSGVSSQPPVVSSTNESQLTSNPLQSNVDTTVDPVVKSTKAAKSVPTTTVEPSKEEQDAPVVLVIKRKSTNSRRIIDPTKDSLFVAIAKLGGMTTQAIIDMGVDLKDVGQVHAARVIQKGKNQGKLTKPALRSKMMGFNLPLHKKKGELTLDGVLEALKPHGYFTEDAVLSDAEAAFFAELRGELQLTSQGIEAKRQEQQDAYDAEMLAAEEANEPSGYNELNEDEQEAADNIVEALFGAEAVPFARGMRADNVTEENVYEVLKELFGDRNSTSSNPEGSTESSTSSRNQESIVDATEDSKTSSTEEVNPEEDGEQASVAEPVNPADSAGKLTILQEVIDLAGEKFSTAYKKINLAAYNLKQKLGKDNKTQRPLIAVKDFLSNWPDEAGLAKFVGVTKLNDAQITLLDHFKELVSSKEAGTGWLDVITKNLVAGKVNQGNARRRDMAAVRDAKDAAAKRKAKATLDSRIASGFYTTPTAEQLALLKAEDPLQYFIYKNEGKADLEENIKTAIAVAAYTYIAENAKSPETKDREAVKSIFGLREYDVIGDALANKVVLLGNPSKVVVNSMGSRVAQALGLSPTEVATQDFLPVLESAFGVHVMKLLIDTGVMQQETVSAVEITQGLATYNRENQWKQKETVKQGDMTFVRMVRSAGTTTKERKLTTLAETISEKSKNTSGVLGKLFGVDAQTVMPSWVPIPFTQKNTDNTNQGVPPDLAAIIEHENKTPFKVNTQVWDLMQALSKEEFLKLAGWIDTDPTTMHKSNILAANAKNDALIREYEVAFDYISQLEAGEQDGGSPLKLDQPIFLSHSVWKQQRVGIEGALNPQASKLHRWLLTRDAWATEIKVDAQGNSEFVPDSDSITLLDSFKLRVMEGLGVKTDKQANEKSLAGFEELFNVNSTDTKTRDRAILLQGAIDGINTGNFEAIIAGVAAGKEKMHSLDALRSMAAYQLAQKEGKAYTFKVNMMGEVDGVTNGPMLSHLALGAGSPAGMMARLNKGGFFEKDSKHVNYNVWRGGENRQDLYEATIAAVIKRVTEAGNTDNFAALQMITGQLHENGTKILSAGRNIIKTPLTAMLFGSTVSGAIDSMFRGFMEKAYEGFETIAQMPESNSEEVTAKHNALISYVTNLNGLLEQAGDAATIKETSDISYYLTKFEFSVDQESALEAIFKDALGTAVKETMETEFADFLAVRDTINNTANAAFGMYWAAYQGVRKDVIAELVKSGEIAADAASNEHHDLTEKQEAIIDKRLRAVNPTVHTYMSKQSTDKNASSKYGLHISKSSRSMSKERPYQGEIHVGNPFPETEIHGKKVTPFSMGTSAYQRLLATPGVGMLPMMIHSLDSAISHMALMGRAVLNVHDAHGTGVSDFIETAKSLNAATWKVLLGYSPATEMRDSFVNTILGMDKMLADGKSEAVVANLRKYIQDLATSKEQKELDYYTDDNKAVMKSGPLDQALSKTLGSMFSTAYTADKTKYETMSKLEYVDQYALEGGQFDVQDSDRAEASKLLKDLGPGAVVPQSVWAAVDRINAAVLGKPVVTPKPAAKSNTTTPNGSAGLMAMLKENGAVPAKEILGALYTQLKNEESSEIRNFRVTLLTQLGKLVSDDLTVVWGLSNARSETDTFAEFDRKNTISISTKVPLDFAIEAVLHEVTHAVTHQIIDKDRNLPLVKELNNLLAKVITEMHLMGHPDTGVFEGDNGIHELVAWGMNNEAFRKSVLEKIQMENKNKGNRFVTAFKFFVDTITEAIFGEASGRRKEILESGMDVLITNFSGLLAQATENKANNAPVNIWHGTNENAVLSNLQQRPFTYEGRQYKSVEHAYQSLKSNSFDQATYNKYLQPNAKNKIVGNKGTNTATNLGLMKGLIKTSFEQNPVALKALLATGGAQLTHTQDKGIWANAFPQMLMEVRSELSTGSLAMMAPDLQAIHDLTTESLYNALDEGKVTPTFDEHLRGLLTSIVTKLHGPYGTFKSQIERNLVRTPKGLWDQAKRDGIVPFASASLAAGIPMNDQVAFVLEQVEVTVASALSDNKGEGHAIATEMDKLYQEAQTKLTAPDSPLSQELQDFLFKMDGGLGGKSDHLARFAALGLAHPEVNAALKFGTSRVESKASESFSGRLETLFHKILEWFNNKMAHTHAGQRADEKLTALVNALVSIETKRKAPMLQKSSTLAYVEGVLKDSTNTIKSKAEAFGRSDWIRNSKSNVIKAAGSVVSTVAGDRTEQVMEVIQQVRDKHFTDGQGLAMGLINEVRGAHDGNRLFHKLLRAAKLREGQREDLIIHTGNVALESFANKGKDLSQEDKAALTAAILRTDLAALLGPFTMYEIQVILNNPASRNRTIKTLEGQLAGMTDRGFYERQAKILGYKLATGNVKGQHLLMNAANIANLAGTRHKANAADAEAAMPIIDQLASLYALRYTNPKLVKAASKVMDAEAKRGNESGVEMIMRLHTSLQQQSREQLFNGSEALMMKGYTPEIYDPKKEVKVATEAEGKLLMEQGYSKGKKHVTYDPTDPSGKEERRIYTRDGGGLRPWLSGNISFTSEAAKGSRSRTDNVKDLADWKVSVQELTYMHKAKQAAMKREFLYDPDFDPSMVDANYAAPTLNADGQVTDYRYLMREENKDALLNRDNRFDKVLGVFAGSIYDKTSTKEHNRKVVQALYDQYKADFGTKSVSYRKIGMTSTDPELRDIYRMLPEDTKQAIAEIWGKDAEGNSFMMVRSDLMDINFGYRKQSISDAFDKEKKNIVEQFFVSVATTAMGGKAAYNLRRAEDVWQELVGEIKDILVVKNVSTLLGNIGSNVSLLYWQGVPFKDMVKYHRIALKGMTNYRADAAALIELETKLAAGVTVSGKATMEREIARLKAAMETNPVKELIDAGLMPSIVEDVSPDNDVYSYKSRLTNYVDEKTSGLNKHVMGAARLGYMAKDTQVYKTLRHATQLSDFVARYSLYQHVLNRKENPLSKEEAVQLASDSFINYDIPSHRNLQYMNDMGFVMFTKYYMRIQKVIARLYADRPGRALAMLAFESYISQAPMLTDSGFLHKLDNNPFGLGALNYPGTLGELATIKAISYPFK